MCTPLYYQKKKQQQNTNVALTTIKQRDYIHNNKAYQISPNNIRDYTP